MIVVVGLSHQTAPIEVRERIALDAERCAAMLAELVSGDPIVEAFVVSTCNRFEVVAAGGGANADLRAVASKTAQRLIASAPEVKGHLYTHVGSEAVRHLFRVAASLDSMVVGEPQILGQVKAAFDDAKDGGTVGPTLNRVVSRALRSAKRVRTETNIGAGQVSIPSVAVDLASQIFGDLSWRTAALVGSGDMGETVARLLRQAGTRLLVTGRNEGRVADIAREMGGEARRFDALDTTLADADVVVTTTSAQRFVVERDRVVKGRRARRGRSLFFIDLAVPRDVDPAVEELDGVFLYNVDDLSRVVADALANRRREADEAEKIVADEAAGYDRWAEGEHVTPTIVALRERLHAVIGGELERSLGGKLKHLTASDRESLAKMVDAAVNKALHEPTRRLRRIAQDDALRAEIDQYVDILGELFELDVFGAATDEESSPDAATDEASGGDGSDVDPETGRLADDRRHGAR